MKTTEIRFLCIWWYPAPQVLLLDDKILAEAASSTRNGVYIELLSAGRIGRVLDYFWMDDQGNPMPINWTKYQETPKFWKVKYFLVWWVNQKPRATVIYDKVSAEEFAIQNRAFQLEIFKNGKIGEAADYKFYDGKPAGATWQTYDGNKVTIVPWRRRGLI